MNIGLKKKLSKKELIDRIRILMSANSRLSSLNQNKGLHIRHINLRFKKIYNMIGYLIEHPYSNDTGFTTRKSKRDIK